MTTKNQHTAGPWTAYNSDHGKIFKHWRINAGTFHQIATIAERKDSGEECANARLIAASPELLEALLAVSKELDHWHNWQLASNENYPKSEGSIHVRNILIKANTAIMKATNL